MYRVALIRSASSNVPKKQYNVQEIGLAKKLAEQGIIVDVFLISDTGKTYSEICGVENRVTVYRLKGIKIPGQQGYYKDLIPILNKNKYDLIQALDDSQITTVLVSNYCQKNNIKFVLWQGMYENYPEMYKRIIQYLYDWTLLRVLRKNTKYTISKTTSAQKYLTDKKFPKGAVIPVGLELSNFEDSIDIDYRKMLNIANEKKILLYIGKVEKRRKPLFCMEVYKKVKERNENCCLIYVGKGPMLELTKEYVKNNNIKDVYFIEQIPQKELPGLYRQADLFLLPTRYEIFGMVLMEAMYFGLPVITYRAAGPIDLIENGKDGIVVNNFDADEWSNLIVKYVFSENITNEMGMNGMKKIKEKYTWENISKIYFEEYIKIIDNKRND